MMTVIGWLHRNSSRFERIEYPSQDWRRTLIALRGVSSESQITQIHWELMKLITSVRLGSSYPKFTFTRQRTDELSLLTLTTRWNFPKSINKSRGIAICMDINRYWEKYVRIVQFVLWYTHIIYAFVHIFFRSEAWITVWEVSHLWR